MPADNRPPGVLTTVPRPTGERQTRRRGVPAVAGPRLSRRQPPSPMPASALSQLLPARQRRGQSSPSSTASRTAQPGSLAVPAVGEPARLGQLRRRPRTPGRARRRRRTCRPPDPGRVEHRTAAGHRDQRPICGGVPPSPVAAQIACVRMTVRPDQGVDQARLARPGRARAGPACGPCATSGRSARQPGAAALTGGTGTPGATAASCPATASGRRRGRPWSAPPAAGRRTPRPARAAARSGPGPATGPSARRPRRCRGWRPAPAAGVLAGGPARIIAVRRGSTASAVSRPSGQSGPPAPSPRRTAARSGSAGGARPAPPPARLARTGPSAASAVQTPRSTRVTRPGRRSRTAVAAYAARSASQPRAVRSMVMSSSRGRNWSWPNTRPASGMITTPVRRPGPRRRRR